jgi:hypothetical protein
MAALMLEVVIVVFEALGYGFAIWGVINWLSGSKTTRPGLDAKTQLIIGLAITLGATNTYHILYPICNSNITQEEFMESIKVYSESGTLISQYDYVTNVHYTHYGYTMFTADDGTSVVVSGGTIIRETK